MSINRILDQMINGNVTINAPKDARFVIDSLIESNKYITEKEKFKMTEIYELAYEGMAQCVRKYAKQKKKSEEVPGEQLTIPGIPMHLHNPETGDYESTLNLNRDEFVLCASYLRKKGMETLLAAEKLDSLLEDMDPVWGKKPEMILFDVMSVVGRVPDEFKS